MNRQIDAKLYVEYPVEADEYLNGSTDYVVRATQEIIIIIEAKRGDLERGFNQLAAELIAIDKYEEPQAFHQLYGAITI